jgi:hypothetical protein
MYLLWNAASTKYPKHFSKIHFLRWYIRIVIMKRLTNKYLSLYLSQKINKVCYVPLITYLNFILLWHDLTYITCQNTYNITSILKLLGKIQEVDDKNFISMCLYKYIQQCSRENRRLLVVRFWALVSAGSRFQQESITLSWLIWKFKQFAVLIKHTLKHKKHLYLLL